MEQCVCSIALVILLIATLYGGGETLTAGAIKVQRKNQQSICCVDASSNTKMQ
ncbi:hypothetical protein HBI56_095880 [Parastagonospora nodorum]|uniref:Uncharacterized protein n=1 Tax=Phaeosphaeria nodorum (strain SN15 / ATCC MYA-4574 / FGSC 10173) TaxID=321614 RepID=A0A7U2F891_PHANO|nr:hypothetical protein HBH56_091270 [Parastagonospora nodorum]QRC98285.1 hypothetical protein JI435_411810 [Parastagonospora nodorum SN15]KAH3936535.1 hypothetical protein HBH54_025910 [Parastagonospora nodorum]KAH3940508.1 hypothetical protein HBH53_215980 [Parastagonospora nodorum]KAH3957765.1 hypothetical protein HBH51_220780 [Parastagonospora nodorum]